MIQVDKKTLSQLQIAMKLDEYKYEKSNQQYFESMPTIGLFDSQIIFINNYIEILEKKNDEKAKSLQKCMQTSKGKMTAIRNFLKAAPKALLLKSMPV